MHHFLGFAGIHARGRLIEEQKFRLARQSPADLETPIGAFLRLDDGGPAFLLESVEGGERLGRYSFLGIGPRRMLEVRDGLAQDLPSDAIEKINAVLKVMLKRLPDYDKLLTGQPIWRNRMAGVGYLPVDACLALGILALDGVDFPQEDGAELIQLGGGALGRREQRCRGLTRRGDEANLLDPISGFAVIDISERYRLGRRAALIGDVSNLFGAKARRRSPSRPRHRGACPTARSNRSAPRPASEPTAQKR